MRMEVEIGDLLLGDLYLEIQLPMFVVVMCEVFNVFCSHSPCSGAFPYPNHSNKEIAGLLRQGYRMAQPDNCSVEV